MIRFRRLRTELFRNLPDRWWEFTPGLQLIRGANEAGKTSLRRALTLALYGDATSRDGSILALARWNGPAMRIELEFEQSGQLCRIVRDFEARKNLLELQEGGQVRSKEQIRDRMRQMVIIPSERDFIATACMAHADLRIENPGEVHRLIEERVISAGAGDVAELIGRLERAHVERHKGLARPVRDPGILRKIRDRLDDLGAQWDTLRAALQTCEDARRELAASQTELTAAEDRLQRMNEHLKRHNAWLQSSKEQTRLGRELLNIEESLRRADQLDRDCRRVTEQWEQLRPRLEGLRRDIASMDERLRLARQLEEARVDLKRLSSECSAIDSQGARLKRLKEEEEALPIRRDEAQNAFDRLPREIANLQEALQQDRVVLEERLKSKTDAQERLAQIRADSQSMAAQRMALSEELDQAALRDQITARRESLGEEQNELARRLDQLAAADVELQALQDGQKELPDQEFRRLHAAAEGLRVALANQAIGLRAEPERPLELKVQLDGSVPEIANDQWPREWSFQRRAEIQISGVVRILLDNRSAVAAELNAKQEELTARLQSCGCAAWEEYERLYEQQSTLMQRIQAGQARKQMLLNGGTPEELNKTLVRLGSEVAATVSRLREIEVRGKVREAEIIRPLVEKINLQEHELREQQAATEARIQELEASLAKSAAVRQLERELERKNQALALILTKAGVREPTQLRSLVETFDRIQQEGAEAEEVLGRTLAGRHADDVQALRDAAGRRVQELGEGLAQIPDLGWTDAEIVARRAGLETLEEQHRGLQKELHTAQGARSAIDLGKLQAQRESLIVELAAVRAAANANEQFRLGGDELLKLEQDISSLEEAAGRQREAVGKWRERAAREEGCRESMLRVEEEVESVERNLETVQFRDAVDEDVSKLVAEARAKAVAQLRQKLPDLAANHLAAATSGRYTRLAGDGLEAAIWSDEKNGPLEDEELSSGTADQLYLAKRLAALEALFGREMPPLLLDDVLVHSDPERRGAVLDLLKEFGRATQVLLFTCQDYPEYTDLPGFWLDRQARVP